MQVRRDYNPKAAQATPTQTGSSQYLISPITGEKIPAEKMEEHMRYGRSDTWAGGVVVELGGGAPLV